MLQVVFVVMSLHPVRLPGLHWGCSRPGHRLQRRAGQARLHSRAIPCRGHCRPFHDQARGEPSWRGQDPAQGLGVVSAEGNRGAFKVAPAAALLRRPDLALAAAGALAAAATAHLASRARTLGAPPPGWPRQSVERPARWQRCQGRRWCWREGGEKVAPRALEGSVMWGAAPPAPAPGGRADGAGREGSAGRAPGCPHLRAEPPRREGAGCVSSFTLCAARRRPGRRPGCFVLAGWGRKVPGGVGMGDGGRQCACPLPERPALTLRSYCGRSAASLSRSASDKARGAGRPQRRQRTKPGTLSVAGGCSLLGHSSSCLLWCGRGCQARGSWGRLGKGGPAVLGYRR